MKSSLKIFTLLLLILTINSAVVRAADNAALEELRRWETLLLTPCDKPLAHMNDLVRLGQTYQDQERQRLAIYRGILDHHRMVLSNFLTENNEKTGISPGTFRVMYDQLYQEANREGLLREASYEDIPEYQNMADMAVRVFQYDAESDKSLRGIEASVGSWSKDRDELGNKIFFVEAQRETAERLRIKMAKLKEEWKTARTEYFKRMETDPYKEEFAELDKRAVFMTGTLRKEFESNRQSLTIDAESGKYEHCLGEIIPSSPSYNIYNEGPQFSLPPSIYKAGDPGTVEALPGMGFRMFKPVVFDPIKAESTDIPEEFPLDLPLKFDPLPYIKTEIECQKIKMKAEKDAIIAMGTYLTGLDGFGGQMVGEAFNIFHGLCEGFGGVGEILIGIGTAPFHPIETYEKLNSIKDGMVHLWESTEAKQALIEKGGRSVVDFFRGIGSGVELLILPDPPEGVYDRYTMEQWRDRAESTQLAREMITNSEKIVGNILADIATGYILSKASASAKVAAEAADTAGDLARAQAKADKVGDALTQAGKMADDVPDAKTIQRLGEQISKSQDDLLRVVDDVSIPKPRDIPYNPQTMPSPDDVLAKARTSTAKGGMNTYVKVDDNLGIKVTNNEILKKADDPTAAAISRAQRDLDDAGRVFLEDVTRDSSLGRLPQVKDRYYVVDDLLEGTKKYTRVEDIPNGSRYKVVDVVENIPPSTHASTLAKEGKLTEKHVRAYEAFMRDMNQKGYVWPDNKLDNFAFEAVDESKGIYRVVPIDTGGVYKVTDLPPGTDPADMARKIQKAYDRYGERPLGHKDYMEVMLGEDLQAAGVPAEMAEDMASKMKQYLGVNKINPTATTVATTNQSGLRLTSPDAPWSGVYKQVSDKADDVLAKELSDATEASMKANPDYLRAREALDAQKAQLAEASKKLEAAEQQLTQSQLAAKESTLPVAAPKAAASTTGSGGSLNPLAGAAASRGAQTVKAALSTAQNIDAAQEKIRCLDIKEKILAGIKADWIDEAWKNCQKLGYTFEGGR